MGLVIFVLVLLFPVAEIYTLIKVASRIGFWDTLLLLIFSGVFGAYLANIQGRITLSRMQACLAEGKLPTKEMMDGMLIFFGGILFVIPGFISDVLGLFLIFPLTRWVVRTWILLSVQGNLRQRQSKSSEGFSQTREPSKQPSKDGFKKDDAQDAEIVE